MAVLLDQLHYTWASRGVEGVNQFQVAALSAGLKAGPAAVVLPMVQRLCRYDPPRGMRSEFPISFGWLDDEGYRIAFRRVSLPPEKGKRGNFAGHFLVGPATELSAPAVAALFGSPFWWNGLDSEGTEAQANREQGFELPQLGLGDLPVGNPPDEASVRAGQALLYGIFTQLRDTRIAVTAPAEELGAAIRAAAQLAPEALLGLSFSTYEGEPIFPFDIVGGDGAGSGATPLALELPLDLDDLSRVTLDALWGRGELSGIAARVSTRHGEPGSPSEIWDVARRIVSLSRDGRGVEGEAVSLLAEPPALQYACESAGGRSAVISAIQTGSSRVAAALKTVRTEMDPAGVDELCSAVAERCRATRELAGCGVFADAVGDAAGKVLDIALELALEDEGAAASLRQEDAAAVLAHAAAKDLDATAVRPLLRALRRQAVYFAKVPQVPNDYLAVMFEFGLNDPGTADRLGDVVRARPALLSQVRLDEGENQRCLDVLRPLANSLGPAAAGRCVVGLSPRREPAQIPPALSQICDELGAALLFADKQPLALQVLERSGSSDAKKSLQVLRDGSHGSRAILDAAVRGSAGVQLVVLREALMGAAIARAVAGLESSSDVTAVWEALRSHCAFEGEMTLLRQLLLLTEEQGTKATAVEVLVWVALIRAPASSKLISRLGKIRDGEVDELSLKLASGISAAGFASRNEFIKHADRRCRKWWKRLRKQHRKGH